MSSPKFNKYRAAIEVLQKGRDLLMDELAETVLDQADDFIEGGFLFNEFLENQGTRLHFLSLLLGQLEQSAETLDEAHAVASLSLPGPEDLEIDEPDAAPRPARKRRTKSRSASSATASGSSRPRGGKKLQQRQSSREGSPDDA